MIYRIQFKVSAPRFTRFLGGSWDDRIGKELPLTIRETDDSPVRGILGRVTLIKADIVEMGKGVVLTLDVNDSATYFSSDSRIPYNISMQEVPEDIPAQSAEKKEKTDRYDIAWRIWCWQQGYNTPEDREGLENWMREDESRLHPRDIAERAALLPIADEVIAMAKETDS